MVLIYDGSLEHGPHIWSKLGISIFWRHLVTSKESSNPIFSRATAPNGIAKFIKKHFILFYSLGLVYS